MSWRQGIASLLHLFILAVFGAAAAYCFVLSKRVDLRVAAADFLLTNGSSLTGAAAGLFGIGVLLGAAFYSLHRGQFLKIRMGRHQAEIQSSLLRKSLEEHFKRKSDRQVFVKDVEVFWSKELEIRVALSKPSEKSLNSLEQELTQVLREKFGYTGSFVLLCS